MYDTTAYQIAEVTVTDPESGLPVEVAIFREAASGALFGIDSSFVEQELANGEHVPSVFGNGIVKLVDSDDDEDETEDAHRLLRLPPETCEDRDYRCCDNMPDPNTLDKPYSDDGWYDRHVAAYRTKQAVA